jgi:uncharacterized protein YcbK (DUF882 family)
MSSDTSYINDEWVGPYEFFSENEMKCKCGCKGLPKHSLMVKLVKLRKLLGPLEVSSGFRCPEYNAQVSNTGLDGPHTHGLAADIKIRDAKAIKLMLYAYLEGFKGFGVSQKGISRFIHIDLMPNRADRQLWSY